MGNRESMKQIRDFGAQRASGFSLIEMMISITIGLMIIAGLVGVLTSNARNSKSNDKTAELQGNGRYALDHLRRELRMAGYRGFTWAEPATPTGAITVTGVTECGGANSGFIQNIRQGIWGANDSNPYSTNCLNGTYLRGDVLVMRRVAGAPVASDCAANPTGVSTLYMRSTYAAGMVYQGTTPPTNIVGAPCGDFPLVEYVYYIGNDDTDATVPALRRVALFTDGSLQDEMVVTGVEHFQVQFARATTDGNARYYDADGIVGTSTDLTKTEWDDVNSVRIWMLARNSKVEAGYNNSQTYALGDANYTVNDSFRRQVFTAVVQLRN
ncbi:MAG: hypothetical protein FD121_895 [Gallionellaceae bacterium]|nr:MAG: hypothetical protein FD121_895 [Gallionellaceae bacterium]